MAGAGDGPHMTPAGGRIPYLDTIETIDQSKIACLALCSKGFLAICHAEIFSKKGGFYLAEKRTRTTSVRANENGSSSVAFLSNTGSSQSCSDDFSKILDSSQSEIDSRFTPKKISSSQLGLVYSWLNLDRRSARVLDCGSLLEFSLSVDGAKLHKANFCRDRLCPMCNWRRSMKIFSQTSSIMDLLEKDYQFLFLTLTVKSCSADDLPKTVQALFDGWRYLYNKCPAFRKVVKGSFRSLEITRNPQTGLFHPHLHCILAVLPSYFKSKDYIKQSEWSKLWANACDLNYSPIVDIRKIKADKNGSLKGAVAETSKYAVKDSDFLSDKYSFDDMAEYVKSFLNALTGRRLCSYTGCFADARKKLNLDDPEQGDLVNVSPDPLRPDIKNLIIRYRWRTGCYVREILENE